MPLLLMISLYPNKYASYESKSSTFDAIERLSARVKKDNLQNRLEGGILGTVKADKVILRYLHLWKWFSGGIRFEGLFAEENGTTVLKGRFRLSKLSRIFMTSWLVVTIVFGWVSIIHVELIAIPVSMLILWIVTILIIARWGKMDIERIEQTISDALIYFS